MRLTRKELIGGAAAASALAATGIYKLVDELTAPPARVAAGPVAPEQHLLDGIRVALDNGIEVLVPPLHHQVVTATLRVGESPGELREARAELENALRRLDERFEPTPAGLGVTVAWGLPLLPAVRARPGGSPSPARPPCVGDAEDSGSACSKMRSGFRATRNDAARAERRRRVAPQ